jgi:hypothetical protein
MSDFSHKHLFASMVCCLMLALLMNAPSAIAAKKSGKGITSSELQSKLMSFSDRLAARVSGATIEYLHIKGYAKSPSIRFAVTSRRLHACSAAVDIASSANPEIALLNMATLVSLLRLNTQDVWVKKNLVPHSQIFLNAYIELEKDIWSIVHSVLSVKQSTELRTMINEWHEKNIHSTVAVTSIRFADFANKIQHSTLIHDGKPGGFLKETNKQIEQTRVLAERTVFIAEREPTLIRWQTEQVFFDLAMEPEFKAMVNNSGNIGRAAQRLANFTKKCPK